MGWGAFAFYSVLGGAAWGTAVALAGYFFGQGWGNTQPWSRLSPSLLALLLGAASSSYLAYRWATSRTSR